MFKFFQKNKQAMTLAELLLVFVIMGIIATMTLVTLKPNEKSLKYIYYRMYNSIQTAFYNTSINMPEYIRNNPDMDMAFPTKAELFCKLLLEYINTEAGTNASCSNEKTVNVDNPDFSDDNVQFVASNGAKVWIGHSANKNKGEFSEYKGTDSTNTEFSLRYYWVFVDLNGKMAPNSPEPKGKNMADIVAFIVTEDYTVIPIGKPEVDPRYFIARVVYAAESSGTDDSDLVTSTGMSYLAAKRHAWGEAGKNFYVSANEPMTINFYDGENITNRSPFWLDYTSSEFDTTMAITVDDECGYVPPDSTTGTLEVEPDACYITIKDYY